MGEWREKGSGAVVKVVYGGSACIRLWGRQKGNTWTGKG